MDLPNDIKQLVFSYCDWKQYYELSVEHKLQLKLKLLNDLPSIDKICKEEIEYLEIVKYLHIHGAPITETTINVASNHGHLEIVKYLHKNGAPITESAFNWASYDGYFEIVKYLHENGASITEGTINMADSNEHLDIVKYLRKNSTLIIE